MTKAQRREHKIGNQLRKKLLLSRMRKDKRYIGLSGSMVQDGKHTASPRFSFLNLLWP